MQQVENLRGRLSEWNPRAQWVQLGLLSASIMAPLVGRWNELRTAERTRALREEAEARLRGMRIQLPWQRNDVLDVVAPLLKQPGDAVSGRSSTRGKVSSRLWLVGVGVGLVAAGVGAFLLVRRRLERSAEEPLVEIPLTSVNGYAKGASNGLNGSQRTPVASSTAGVSNALALTKEQTSSQSASQLAQPDALSVPMYGAGEGSVTGAIPRTEAEMPVGAEQPEDAPFIGNIRTMIYHASDAYNLPAEENRIYFASEDEAHAAGYRRSHDELPATETESQAESNA